MRISPVTQERLVARIVDVVLDRPGRVRLAIDGAPPTRPEALAAEVATALRTQGRAVVVVSAIDFLRPASVRLERGRTDPDEFLDSWLDVAGLCREVLEPAGPSGTGRVLPRLWNARADRAYRAGYVELPADGVVVLVGALLLGRGLPLDLAVHLHMGTAQLARRIAPEERWTLPAYARYDTEHEPAKVADLLVLADHPERPAMRE